MAELDQQQVWEMIEDLREWAKDRWGEEPIDPTGPDVGMTIKSIPFDTPQPWEEGETEFVYTQEMHERDHKANPHRYKPRWLYELQELVEGEEPL